MIVHRFNFFPHYSFKDNGQEALKANGSLVDAIMGAVTSALQNEEFFTGTSNNITNDEISNETETIIVDIDRIDNTELDPLHNPGGNDSSNLLLKSSLGNLTTNSDCDQTACVVESPRNSPGSEYPSPRCNVKSDTYIMYYFTLLFMLCFATPVLITTSLNVYISSAVRSTAYDNIANHQWLTLAACVLMWCPCLLERMMSKWGVITDRLAVSVFLFLLGHTHNLLRSFFIFLCFNFNVFSR